MENPSSRVKNSGEKEWEEAMRKHKDANNANSPLSAKRSLLGINAQLGSAADLGILYTKRYMGQEGKLKESSGSSLTSNSQFTP